MNHTNSTTPDNSAPAAAPLWNRNFTILILGSAVTMLGHALSGFAVSQLVLDYTGSVFLYSVYLAAYFLPMVVMPLLAGPWMDNFSRAKVIYSLDFLAAGLYLLAWLLLRNGWFSYVPFLLGILLVGTIDSVYLVAYDSLFPNLISPGNYARGYAISSMLYPLAAMMTPVASWIYTSFGVPPLFLGNFFFFLVAACFETQIRAPETYRQRKTARLGVGYMLSELRAGFRYLRGEKGLLIITAYFFFTMLFGGGYQSLTLPYFRSVPALGTMAYAIVQAFNVGGRFVGGFVQYRFKYPTGRKFAIALAVYLSISVLDGTMLYWPEPVMMGVCFFSGLLGVTSYNIRISTTQSYVPDEFRGRFNGCFQMITQGGTVIGQLLGGALGEALPFRPLVSAFCVLNMIACLCIMLPGREHVKGIYNRDV